MTAPDRANAESPFCPGPMTRRTLLKAGAMAFGGVGLAGIPALRAAAKEAGKLDASRADTSVIFLWLPGGIPHLETFDMKPDAPAEFRGDFRPIRTNVAGIEICEHLPTLARHADKFSLIRSITHKFADHGGGHKRFMTGRDPKTPTEFVNDCPAVGSMIARVRDRRGGLPDYVAGVDNGRSGIDVFSLGSAYLPQATHPFFVVGNPAAPDFRVQNVAPLPALEGRLGDRIDLLSRFDRFPRSADPRGEMSAMDDFNRRAMDMLNTDAARRAFDLSRESDKTRDRYGRHAYGHRCLMARRLAEAGAGFVTMILENPGGEMPADCCYNWDCHAVNCNVFTDAKWKLRYLDQALSALLADLWERGLDRKVMVVVASEFGHTPKLERGKERPGRDHWPAAASVLVSGGGLRMGTVVGKTNPKGEFPVERPLAPEDIWATVLRHLGIDPQGIDFLDSTGRPMPMLPDGQVISELV
jgi:hypothetical protein